MFDETSDDKRLNVLLIVTIASRSRQMLPFHFDNENNSYAHLCSLCAAAGMNLYITHYDNVLPGSSVFSWIYQNDTWKLKNLDLSQVSLSYADLPPNEEKANVLRHILKKYHVRIVNDLQMSDCLTDKVLTYKMLSEFIPPTLDSNDPDVAIRLQEMPIHPDLSLEKLFLKPRFGERGKGIEIIDFSELVSASVLKKRQYIVQPLLESDAGIPELNIPGRHDLRLLLYNGEIIQFFARLPALHSYVSNKSHGGKLFYYDLHQLPEKFQALALRVDTRLQHYGPRFYSIDVGVGRSGKLWIYELNTMPGIVWEEGDVNDQTKNIEVHQVITEMLISCLRE